ncbi:HAMP domain-containing sensor histidine kinase [Vibrio penaeicida]|uniref:sensor histidine kinase n=1 Tax=Vibrio penaeicida TaxID=104609 RepID=UPI0027340486|nr:HAMP domain-containing sensor histidine kinase [Vibrio penaeicida]MDP2574274.1 HAMP domain-containing sensor histidine kinase [Vibrio penaeicida]
MSMLRNRKDRMLAASIFVLAMLVVLGIWAASSLLQINNKIERTIDLSERRSNAILTATSAVNSLETELVRLVIENEPGLIELGVSSSIETNELLEESISNLRDQLPNNDDVKWLAILTKEMVPERNEIIALAKRNSDAIAFDLIEYLSPKITEVSEILAVLIQQDQKHINGLLRDYRNREYTTLAITALAVIAGIAILVSLITRLRKASKKLDRLNLQLEEQVDQRTKQLEESFDDLTENVFALEQAQAKLVESEKMASLGVLVKGVAHELNTPIGIGITSASHMKEKVMSFEKLLSSGKLSKKSCEQFIADSQSCLEMVQDNLEKSSELIQCFKKIAIEHESVHEDAVMVSELIEDIVTNHDLTSEDNVEIELEGQSGISAFVFKEALLDVMNNLIENAVHHSDETTKKVIEIETQVVGTDISIVIKDKGKGIDEENLAKIFDPFFTTQRGQGRNGLGLAVVYNLVTHLLDGKINCKSRPGEGTTFEVTFPYKPAI